MPNRYDIRIAQGRRWSVVFTYSLKSTGELIDLTGYTAEFRLGDELTLTQASGITLGGVGGTVTIVLSAVQTAALTAQSGAWELDVTSAGGIPVANEPLQGSYTVEARPLG